MLKTCNYELWSKSSTGKLINFTRFIISANLRWGLSAGRARANITMSPQAKKALMNVKRGSEFLLRWGWGPSNFTQVKLYWVATDWEIGARSTVRIELVHSSWQTTRVPVVSIATNAKATDVVKAVAASKNTKINTTKAALPPPGANSKVVAVSQTIAEEINRQFKGQFVIPNKDGVTLDVVSFENLKDKAQVYYISTEYGYLDKLAINYKAKLPKDKSYIEVAGGSGAPANANPTANPSSVSAVLEAVAPTLDLPTYAILQSTNTVSKLNNPILSLSLYKDKQFLGLFSAVSGNAFKRDSKKLNNVLPNGEYTIASNTIRGTSTELGGLFLPITPKFKTNRSALGIHLDPSFNKANGKDGTYGSIGLTTAADRDQVQKLILENRITTLIVDLDSRAPAKQTDQVAVVKTAYLVSELNTNTIYAEQSRRGKVKTVASMFKVFVGIAVVNKQADLSTAYEGESLLNLLTKMLTDSNNEATNKLINFVGGVEALNRACQASGFLKSKIDSLYTDVIGLKQSTCNDLVNAFKLIFLSNKYSAIRPLLVGDGLGLPNETHSKTGNNTVFEGGLALVQKPGAPPTVVCILAENEAQLKQIIKLVTPKLP